MKYALIALSLLPSLAHADFSCSSVKQGPDHGYFATVTEEGQAQISMQSIAGPQHLATLECMTPVGNGNPNIPHTIYKCGGTQDGYQLTITSGGVVGISGLLTSGRGVRISMLCRFN